MSYTVDLNFSSWCTITNFWLVCCHTLHKFYFPWRNKDKNQEKDKYKYDEENKDNDKMKMKDKDKKSR